MPQDTDIAGQWKSFTPERRKSLLGKMSPEQKQKLRSSLEGAGPSTHGAGGSWQPEGTLAKGWRIANTPLIPEGQAEREGHQFAASGPTKQEIEFTLGPKFSATNPKPENPTLGPLIAGAKRGLAGTYADTLETARAFSTPLAIATAGLGTLGRVPGAVGRLATVASKLTGLGFGAQGTVQAGKGALDMAKRGVTPENVRETLTGAGQAVLGGTAVMGPGGQAALTERLPLRLINQLIKPSVADVKFGKNPGMAILEEKLTANSLPALGDKVYGKMHEVGKQIDQTLQAPQNAQKRINVDQSLKPIDDAMVEAAKAGRRPLYNRLVQLKQQLRMQWQQQVTPKGKQVINPVGPRNLVMNPFEATEFKRMVGDDVKWTGNDPFEDTLNGVKGEIYGKIKDQVNQAVPEVVSLNERYSNLVGAGKAIERRIPVAERNAHWSLSDIALGATGHIPTAIARKVLSGPAVKTRVAVGLSSLAPNQ